MFLKKDRILLNELRLKCLDSTKGRIYYSNDYTAPILTNDIIIVLHGTTPDNERKAFQGSRSDYTGKNELSSKGELQTRSATSKLWQQIGDQLLHTPEQVIFFTSPLKRSKQTANYFFNIAKSNNIEIMFEQMHAIEEIDFGEWDGKRLDELPSGEYENAIRYRQGDVFVHSKNGECFLYLLKRVRDFIVAINQLYFNKTIVFFGHGTFTWALNVTLRTSNVVSLGEEYINWRDITIDRANIHIFKSNSQKINENSKKIDVTQVITDSQRVINAQRLRLQISDTNSKILLHVMPSLGTSKTYVVTNRVFNLAGTSLVCIPVEVPLDGASLALKEIISWIKHNQQIIGANISAPYKTDVVPFLDHATAIVRCIGVTIILKNHKGQLIGEDDIGKAWTQWYESIYGALALRNKQIVILGAGPSGLSIAYNLLMKEVSAITMTEINIKSDRIQSFISILPSYWKSKFRILGFQNDLTIRRAIQKADILINATGIGKNLEDKSPIQRETLHQRLQVIDLNYRPNTLEILKMSKSIGAQAYNGDGLFLHLNANLFSHYEKIIPDLNLESKSLSLFESAMLETKNGRSF